MNQKFFCSGCGEQMTEPTGDVCQECLEKFDFDPDEVPEVFCMNCGKRLDSDGMCTCWDDLEL